MRTRPILCTLALLGCLTGQAAQAMTVEEAYKKLMFLTEACARGNFTEAQCRQAKQTLLDTVLAEDAVCPPLPRSPLCMAPGTW